MHAQKYGRSRQGIVPLTRRRSLCIRCARPGEAAGQGPENRLKVNPLRNGLQCWQCAARFRRTLVVVKRQELFQPSSLDRGSAATRIVVRSISSVARLNELTYISRINRR
jgi:hypothetical protein